MFDNVIKFKAKTSVKKDANWGRKFCSFTNPTFHERKMGIDDLIVSKTDLTGKITYANETFLKMAGLSEQQAIGAPHSIIRHPDMPRAVFKLLWDRISNGQETFAYVVNYSANGDFYWVFAHVTPTYDNMGKIVGYHSSRRKPDDIALERIKPIYKTLLDIENANPDPKEGLQQSFAAMVKTLQDGKTDYDRFVFSLTA
jgi:PAS domain S-box-containing protein